MPSYNRGNARSDTGDRGDSNEHIVIEAGPWIGQRVLLRYVEQSVLPARRCEASGECYWFLGKETAGEAPALPLLPDKLGDDQQQPSRLSHNRQSQ